MSFRRSGGNYRANTRNYSLFAINNKVNANIKATAQLASLLNIEYKVKDVDASGAFVNTGTLIHLSPITQGDGNVNREGNQVKCFSISSKWEIAGTAAADSYVRMMWILDTEARSGVPPVVADILQSVTTNSHINFDTGRRRFVILRDLRGKTETTFELNTGSYYKKINYKLNWDGAAGDTYVNNSLWLLLLTNVASNQPSYSIKNRLLYLDN